MYFCGEKESFAEKNSRKAAEKNRRNFNFSVLASLKAI